MNNRRYIHSTASKDFVRASFVNHFDVELTMWLKSVSTSVYSSSASEDPAFNGGSVPAWQDIGIRVLRETSLNIYRVCAIASVCERVIRYLWRTGSQVEARCLSRPTDGLRPYAYNRANVTSSRRWLRPGADWVG